MPRQCARGQIAHAADHSGDRAPHSRQSAEKEPVPISEATIEAGRITVWGEVFDIESRETRDGSRKIYSIDITDYTNSITLKLIQQANDCSKIDAIKRVRRCS